MAMSTARIYTLRPYRELRIITVEMPDKFDTREECIRVRILPIKHLNKNDKSNCTAEIFGRELVIDKDYIFGFNEKFAIYTYTGCVVQIKGKTLQEYESKNNSMKEYISLSYILDSQRELAKRKKTIGPRILLTGNNNSGKSTASLLFCNYALKSGFTPFYIEADPKCTSDKMELSKGPGILSCFVYNNMNRKYSLDYFFGFLDIKEDIQLYYHLNECISSCVHLHFLNNLSQQATDFNINNDIGDLFAAGFILSVPSEADIQVIHNLIQIYKINIVIVIDNSFLHYSLKYYYNKEGNEGMEKEIPFENVIKEKKKGAEDIEIVALPKFEGVISADGNRLRYCKNLWFYNYFSKDIFIDNSYFKKSHLLVFKCSSTNFVKLDSTSSVPLSALPADCKNVKLENASASYYTGDMKNLINCILGVSYSKDFFYVHVMNIAAFVHVKNVTEIYEEIEEEKKGKKEKENEIIGEIDMKKDKWNEMPEFNKLDEMNEKDIERGQDLKKEKEETFNTDNILTNNETKEQYERSLEDEHKEKKNAEKQSEQEEEKKKDYIIEILCPVSITLKNIPPYIVVPGNAKQIKC